MKKPRIITVAGEEYVVHRTAPFYTSYGIAGSKGLDIMRKKDYYSMGRYSSIKEFRDERRNVIARSKRMMK
jgi:hypothetical protein